MAVSSSAAPGLPTPAGPYNHSVRGTGTIVATAGQVGKSESGEIGKSFEEQAAQAIANVMTALAASGAQPSDILKLTVYLTDREHFASMNEVYRRLIPEPHPARTTVYVGLPVGLLIEIDALAIVSP